MSEYLDTVDTNDDVVGNATRDEIYDKLLRHRIVHVLIFNDKDELALQLRSPNVSFCPSHWSTTVGGHVQSGETYEQAALREYEEELGTRSELEFFSKDLYTKPGGPQKFLVTYRTRYNGPFSPDPHDVSRVDFFTIGQIKDMIARGEKFHPELSFILQNLIFTA